MLHRTKNFPSLLKYSVVLSTIVRDFDYVSLLYILARLRRPPAAFIINGAITRGAKGHKTFGQTCPSYMQSFIKIRGAVLEKSGIKIMTLCNFNKDSRRVFLEK